MNSRQQPRGSDAQPIDWRSMFRRYMHTVSESEGIYFLYEDNWSAAEWVAIGELRAEIDQAYLDSGGEDGS